MDCIDSQLLSEELLAFEDKKRQKVDDDVHLIDGTAPHHELREGLVVARACVHINTLLILTRVGDGDLDEVHSQHFCHILHIKQYLS